MTRAQSEMGAEKQALLEAMSDEDLIKFALVNLNASGDDTMSDDVRMMHFGMSLMLQAETKRRGAERAQAFDDEITAMPDEAYAACEAELAQNTHTIIYDK
jgi:hypothetical protein